jgi:hypothetical protein
MPWRDLKDDHLCGPLHRIEKDGCLLFSSRKLATQISGSSAKFYLAGPARVKIGLNAAPREVYRDGRKTNQYVFDKSRRELSLSLPAGEGLVAWK